MTFNEKEEILYRAIRLVNDLLESDEPDFVDEITRAVANAELDTLEYMRDDLYEEWNKLWIYLKKQLKK